MDIENPINQKLIEMDLTQVELAREIKVDRALLCNVINGTRQSNPVKYKLSKFFRQAVNDLFPEDVA